MSSDVLERSVFHAGKVFINIDEENTRAYIIQTGEVRSFIMKDGEKLEVERYGPGTIIGETALANDQKMKMGYESLNDSTMVTITRQDFQKKLVKSDSLIKNTFGHVLNKLDALEKILREKAMDDSDVDEQALQLTMALISDVTDDKQDKYKDALLPPLNRIIKELKRLKEQDKADAKETE